MKHNLILLLFFSISINAQMKIDTLNISFDKQAYLEQANIYVKNLIQCNIKIKKDLNKKNDIYELLYDGDISELKIISIPILKFKKEVLNYKKGENLISYIDFTTNVLEQNIMISYKNKLIYDINIKDINFEKLHKNYKDNLFYIDNQLILKKEYEIKHTTTSDLPFHFEDKFFFFIMDRFCMVINGDVFELANEGGIKMTLFEYVFGSSLDEIMKKTAGSTERVFKINDVEYDYKNKLYLKMN
jgi:hypothetical protein